MTRRFSAAYRYSARPFNLKLALSPLAMGDSLNQIVDRASLVTRISKEGQVVTNVRYFIKNRGNPHLRLTLAPGEELWAATVDGATVVPVKDKEANLVPLPQRADPNSVLALDLKIASRSTNAARVKLSAPLISAPVMLAEWQVQPDERQRLVYQGGSLTPVEGAADVSGFGAWTRTFTGPKALEAWMALLMGLSLLALAVVAWHWASRSTVTRYSAQHSLGLGFGILALVLAGAAMVKLGDTILEHRGQSARDIRFLVPVQQAGSDLHVEIANLEAKASMADSIGRGWPAMLGLAAWVVAWVAGRGAFRAALAALGWLLVALAALRSTNGGLAALCVLAAFFLVHVAWPMLVRVCRVQPRVPSDTATTEAGISPAVTGLLAGGLVWMAMTGTLQAADATNEIRYVPRAAAVSNDVVVAEDYASGRATLRWQAVKGQMLPLIFEPAVMTAIDYPTNDLKLVRAPAGSRTARQLVAQKTGAFNVTVHYQVPVTKRGTESGFVLPIAYGLINTLRLSLNGLDVAVASPQAIASERSLDGTNTVASLVLVPADDTWIGWKPLSRDVRREKTVFYAEITHLYVPTAGVIEGAHEVSIRPAQGEIGELLLTVPTGATVTDVVGFQRGATAETPPGDATAAVSLWRFDPETRKLRVALKTPQSRPFALLVRLQVNAGPLPFEQTVGLLQVDGAAGQIGLVGVATGNEVQLDDVTPSGLSSINLEDFPAPMTATVQLQVPAATVRRAFRFAEPAGTAVVKASAVEPDVRVESQDTVSLGEDRTVLAANVTVEILRAGIFRLSFALPETYDVESISGSALSHWTELKNDGARMITLHLTGKTTGKQSFAISLSGPGVKTAAQWSVPKVLLREASKHRGTLLLVPEQGLRLQAAAAEGLTQLDPQKAGIKQKGVLAFRVLQAPWDLKLGVEQVAPWIQVTSLQHVLVTEAQLKVTANLQYQIENTGLKSLRVLVPTNAESVRFTGDQVADFLPVRGAVTNSSQTWEIKLHRRVIGNYLLQLAYQLPVADQTNRAIVRGLQVTDVNLQRGFVTIQSSGRLQLRADAIPESLQPAEFQSIPKNLQQDLGTAAANLTFRLVEPAFELPLGLERHDAAKLLAARVTRLALTSVISDNGVMLTRATLELVPGDKRLLEMTLPAEAKFWFAFVNQGGVWPWRQQDRLLIPIEQQSRGSKPVNLEVFYSSQIGSATPSALKLGLGAPKFDLPLENITWTIALADKWKLKKWSGALQLQEQRELAPAGNIDLNSYLQNETVYFATKTREAEESVAAANSALEQGNPQLARRALQNAFSLSAHDSAFNEDARVQLHNVKLQQALVGLNLHQAATAGEPGALGGKLRELRGRKELQYSQQDAKTLIERASADENAAFMRLAERLIQQQDASVASPAAIRANIPEQGRLLTFKRAVVVDTWADLKINLEASAARPASTAVKFGIIAALALLGVIWAAAVRFSRNTGI